MEQDKLLEQIKLECDCLKNTLINKNISYGTSAFERPMFAPAIPASMAILARLGDKVKRLEWLSNHFEAGPVFGETYNDTLMDLAGYCILARVADRLETFANEKKFVAEDANGQE